MRLEHICLYIHPYIVFTKEVPYTRNGKRFIRNVKLKEPEAHYSATYQLLAYEELELCSIYVDDLGHQWMCTTVTRFHETVCNLKPITHFIFTDELHFPKRLTKIRSRAGESSNSKTLSRL